MVVDMKIPKYNPKIHFKKENVTIYEFNMQKLVYNLKIVNVPKIIHYNKQTKTLIMQKINGICISDNYGNEPNCIPSSVMEKIQDIVNILYQHDVIYPDITGYNFIQDENDDNKIWVIDFEHAFYNDPYIRKFMTKKTNEWNREFV